MQTPVPESNNLVEWAAMAGTALSGLGMTLNGIHSLYGLSEHVSQAAGVANSAMTGTVVSGAAALASGWLASLKLGVGGLSLTTVSLGAGAAYASIGFLYFMYSIVRVQKKLPPKHAPPEGSPEALLYPSPEWLSTRVLNWGVMGRVGVGKSTLINSLRGLTARDPEAAPVGIGHTTRRPQPYSFVGDVAKLTKNMARLWDLPGAGTQEWSSDTYIRDTGLRHFDGVIFVTSDAFSEIEASLMNQLMDFKVPYYIVRNKVDQDVQNNAEDNGASVEDSLSEIRSELRDRGCDPARTFLISAKHPQCADFEFGLLLRMMASDVVLQRNELPEFIDEVTPSRLRAVTSRFRTPEKSRPSVLQRQAFSLPALGRWHRRSLSNEAASSVETPPPPSRSQLSHPAAGQVLDGLGSVRTDRNFTDASPPSCALRQQSVPRFLGVEERWHV
mmetsp:Transcript_155528/g.270553  ORF Transcript_155528/g.270553 Transcript_155528/m.270553 type:complete len:444 (+) Transcript_155528:79-1410(+)